jgi:hypothetical protein
MGCSAIGKSRHVLQLTHYSVWTEIHIHGGFNLPVANHYFPSNIDINITENYFNSLETKLIT